MSFMRARRDCVDVMDCTFWAFIGTAGTYERTMFEERVLDRPFLHLSVYSSGWFFIQTKGNSFKKSQI